jgi:hypothetical protein
MFGKLAFASALAWAAPAAWAHGDGHGDHAAAPAKPGKPRPELGISAAFDAQGVLWVAGKEAGAAGDHVVLRRSADAGRTWSEPMRVNARPEPVSADGENRPKLAFGHAGQVYLTWTRPTSERYTGDIRFARSADGGRSWQAPVNVHRDTQRITHRFESLWVDRAGRPWVAWIDKRDQIATQKAGKPYEGAAIYYAFSPDGGASWQGDFKLADASCECCRIATALDTDGAPLALWRHVFPGSERDHALAKLDAAERPPAVMRATFDRWKIAACPHHGPGLAVTADGVRHAVWFNHVKGEGRAFYGRLGADGVQGQAALPDPGAEHPDIAAAGRQVWIAWRSFDGRRSVARTRHSTDGGLNWSDGPSLATEGNADQVRLALKGERAWLVWNTQKEGVRVEALP